MLPLRDLVAWRPHAPWASDIQVEQDLLLTRAMQLIFQDDFLSSQLAMRGGTVLHKVHLAPAARYSEDIDLVQTGDRPVAHVEKALKRVLASLLGRPRASMVADVTLAVRNLLMPSKILRLDYEYRPTTDDQVAARIKIEVNHTERQPFYAIVELPYRPALPEGPADVVLRSYDIDEMLGTKMRALLQRTQGRDLFDLWWAWTASEAGQALHTIDPDRTVAAFNDYMRREGNEISQSDFADELARKMKLRTFRHDTTVMLRKGLPLYDPHEAESVVKQVLLCRLKA